MNIEANAKINLALDVVRRRADGYHELRMIMLPLQLHDTLTIVRSVQDKLESDCPQMPCDESNLILKALAFMRARCGISEHFHIMVQKRIPMQAGLAGGSADAGAMIRALHAICGIAEPLDKIAEASKCVGADVPYCVMNQCARVEGIGEKVRPLRDHCSFHVLLVKPPCGIETGKAYQMLDLDKAWHPDIDLVERCLLADEYETLCGALGNTLEYSAFQMEPQIRAIRAMLTADGADAALMSGSGSAVFALSRDLALLQRLQPKYEALGLKTWLTGRC